MEPTVPKPSNNKRRTRQIEDNPFVSFTEWSTKADDAAYAHLADQESRLDASPAAIDDGDTSGIADEFDFDLFLKSRRRRT
jgi:hypothetical protein